MIIKDTQLKTRILQEIAKSYPFSVAEVEAVYNATSSFDDTIKVCQAAVELGTGNPLSIIFIQAKGQL